MPRISFQGKQYQCDADKTLLCSLNSQGADLQYGCQAGVCQSCMLKAKEGDVPVYAQTDIAEKLRAKNYFLPCICKPESDMIIELPDPADKFNSSIVFEKEWLNASVVRLRCSRPEGFDYRPGQFVNLLQAESGLIRSYSLASTCKDNFLEFHIRLSADGRMSKWIAESVENGTYILISNAMGNCCYNSDYKTQPLLLAGTGTGLAPLYGILRDAFASDHTQPVRLLHGALNEPGLYYQQNLARLTESVENFSYVPCVIHGSAPTGGYVGAIDRLLSRELAEESNWRVFLCGDSNIVAAMRRVCLQHGIDELAIHTDAYG